MRRCHISLSRDSYKDLLQLFSRAALDEAATPRLVEIIDDFESAVVAGIGCTHGGVWVVQGAPTSNSRVRKVLMFRVTRIVASELRLLSAPIAGGRDFCLSLRATTY